MNKSFIDNATPLKNDLYWHNDRDDDFFLHMARMAEADIMIYGHTYIPYRNNPAISSIKFNIHFIAM